MADVEIEILNAVNGEQLAVFTINTSETLQELYLRVRSMVSTDKPALPRLLLDGKEVFSSSALSISDGGIEGPGPVALMLIWRSEPATLTCLGLVDISDEGYHCHDTRLVHVSSPDSGTFHMSWTRSYDSQFGCYRAHIDAIRSRKLRSAGSVSVSETVAVDALNDVSKDKAPPLNLWHIPTDRGRARNTKILAIFDGKVLVSKLDECHVLEMDAKGHLSVVWRSNTIDLVKEEGCQGPLQLQEMWVVKDKIVALATCPEVIDGGNDAEVLLKGTLDDAGLLSFTQWGDVKNRIRSEISMIDGEICFVGSDACGRYMMFQIDEGELACLSLETLQTSTVLCPRLEIFEDFKGERHIHCVMDPVTEDLYFLVDCALRSFRTNFETPSCIIYRLRAEKAEDGDLPLAPDFLKSSYDLICWQQLGIDGFSDSFCISLCRYASASDAILIFDASDRLWSLPLKQARAQDALTRGWEYETFEDDDMTDLADQEDAS